MASGSRPVVLRGLAHDGDEVGQRRVVALAGEEAVAEAPGPAGCSFGVAADHDRHGAVGRGGQAHGALPHGLVAVVEVDLLAGPQRPHGGHVGIGARATPGERDPEGVELLLEPADTDSQQQPPAREAIEGGAPPWP
jgi:hypothetical protein